MINCATAYEQRDNRNDEIKDTMHGSVYCNSWVRHSVIWENPLYWLH